METSYPAHIVLFSADLQEAQKVEAMIKMQTRGHDLCSNCLLVGNDTPFLHFTVLSDPSLVVR